MSSTSALDLRLLNQQCNGTMNLHYLAALLGLVISLRVTANADTVHLKNGDRLTGTIERLEDGTLYLNTDYAGVLEIVWEKVAELSSDQTMRVESAAGMQFTGRLSGNTEIMEIRTEDNQLRRLATVISILSREPDDGAAGLWSKLSGSVDVGLSLSRGNSHFNELSFNLATRYRRNSLQVVAELDSLFSSSSEAVATSRHSGSVRVEQYFAPRHFSFILGSLERDDGERLATRSTAGGGLGWKVVTSRRVELSLLAGSTYVDERFFKNGADRKSRKAGNELLFAVNLEKALIGRNILTTKLSVFPHVLGASHYRVSLDSGLRMPLAGPLTLSLRAFDRFNSAPHLEVKRNDYGVLSGLGVTF